MMIGAEQIFKLRLQGFVPISIFVDEVKVCTDWFNPGEKYGEVWEPDFPHVCIFPDEQLEFLDLRFCVGTRVHVSSDSEKRAKELLEAFKGAGAAMVASSCSVPVDGKSYCENIYFEIWHKY